VGAVMATAARGAWRVLEGGGRGSATGPARSAHQEEIDDVQNKLASVIANLELVLELESDAALRGRAERALASAWHASQLVAAL
jgi:hypothetical protein